VEPDGDGRRHVFREDVAAEMARKGIYADNVLVSMTDRERLEWSFDNFKKLRKAGVKVLPGTDGLRLYETAGLALVLEMMVRGGASPMEVILSATSVAAKALRMGSEVGTLEAGKEADLIAVQGDPLKDIRVLRAPKLVMKAGNKIPPSGRSEAAEKADALAQKVLSTLDESGIS
jgi:imidazolonepropionase-like amidohydrolase